ncbi:MAG TPA: epimerase, partial [Gemmatimonadetes bacterium]|nr:epimerase [Gemmatimonadota bacterium]
MSTDRREFLRLTAATAGTLALGITPHALAASPIPRPVPPAKRAIRILILGGTGFIGPYQVRYALERGHTVTLFNRGRTNTHLFPGVERLVGDRNGQLAALAGRTWDAVIDNSRANPEWVRLSAEFLKDSVDRYFYVSSRSAYADTSRVPMTADAPTFTYETAGISRDAERLPY